MATTTSHSNSITIIASVMGMLAGAQPGLAQTDEELSVELAECVGIEPEAERFACYERRVEAARAGQSGAAANGAERGTKAAQAGETAASQPADVVRSANAHADVAAGGAGEEADRVFGATREDRREFTSTVESVRERMPEQYVITLENGQVWYQMRPEKYPLQPGHEVRVYPTRWGEAYRLAVEELGGFIQVERVR